MFHLIPAPLHRAALRLAHGLRKRWWRMARPDLVGCCMIGLDDRGRVLLVRHSYGTGLWALPGGAMRRGEDPAHAAAREWGEEIGCALADLRAVAVLDHTLHGAHNTVYLFAGRIAGEPVADGREIAEIGLFPPDALPPARSRTVDTRLALLTP
ncbi:hypothetical protein NT2_10_00440 [Caenibius tardaugens NBRC 16725]|uniref:Nudix hydrolase domain-containing protein n=1 Tax=Caenibius tardaugens NBRC 16725 TaxID=1219035 RepID=U2ZYY4_9SPHN|nr:NUDIX domain-containing protein [Caenibius tardaugens]AZI35826.1 NUDIX domain-containing protein [Caenibius tardaugens NBRC 16725]GAD50599.1 hypothetical protein NT2_10_00440 [Caenibius tardaugens NBRC 16725]